MTKKNEHKDANINDEKPGGAADAHEETAAAPDPASTCAESEVDKLRIEIGDHKKKAAEYLDMAQRVQAEFENYKRRATKERADTMRYAAQETMTRLLPVVDNLQRGIAYAEKGSSVVDLLKGMKLVEKDVLNLLGEYSVESYDSVNQPFDPNLHEALYTVERDDLPENTVAQEEVRGYRMHDRVIRAAKVVVSRAPEKAAGDEGEVTSDGE